MFPNGLLSMLLGGESEEDRLRREYAEVANRRTGGFGGSQFLGATPAEYGQPAAERLPDPRAVVPRTGGFGGAAQFGATPADLLAMQPQEPVRPPSPPVPPQRTGGFGGSQYFGATPEELATLRPADATAAIPAPRPAADNGFTRRVFNGNEMVEATVRDGQYDPASFRRNGQAFDGGLGSLEDLRYKDVLAEGKRQTGFEVPSAQYLANTLFKANTNSPYAADRQGLQQALGVQGDLAQLAQRREAAKLADPSRRVQRDPKDDIREFALGDLAQYRKENPTATPEDLSRRLSGTIGALAASDASLAESGVVRQGGKTVGSPGTQPRPNPTFIEQLIRDGTPNAANPKGLPTADPTKFAQALDAIDANSLRDPATVTALRSALSGSRPGRQEVLDQLLRAAAESQLAINPPQGNYQELDLGPLGKLSAPSFRRGPAPVPLGVGGATLIPAPFDPLTKQLFGSTGYSGLRLPDGRTLPVSGSNRAVRYFTDAQDRARIMNRGTNATSLYNLLVGGQP